MHTRSRLFASLLTGALLGTLLPAAAVANELVPGRPGRYELSSITIDATTGDCRATYETPAKDNLWMRGVDSAVRVVVSPNGVHVNCRFTDMSYLIELNAEVGHTNACTLVTETATFAGGRGMATSAANISERSEGGNTTVTCHFAIEPAPLERPAAGPKAAGATESGGRAQTRGRGKPADVRAQGDAAPSRDARPDRRSDTRTDPAKTGASSAKTDKTSATAGTAAKSRDGKPAGPRSSKAAGRR